MYYIFSRLKALHNKTVYVLWTCSHTCEYMLVHMYTCSYTQKYNMEKLECEI
jgi:hypothetical protein